MEFVSSVEIKCHINLWSNTSSVWFQNCSEKWLWTFPQQGSCIYRLCATCTFSGCETSCWNSQMLKLPSIQPCQLPVEQGRQCTSSLWQKVCQTTQSWLHMFWGGHQLQSMRVGNHTLQAKGFEVRRFPNNRALSSHHCVSQNGLDRLIIWCFEDSLAAKVKIPTWPLVSAPVDSSRHESGPTLDSPLVTATQHRFACRNWKNNPAERSGRTHRSDWRQDHSEPPPVQQTTAAQDGIRPAAEHFLWQPHSPRNVEGSCTCTANENTAFANCFNQWTPVNHQSDLIRLCPDVIRFQTFFLCKSTGARPNGGVEAELCWKLMLDSQPETGFKKRTKTKTCHLKAGYSESEQTFPRNGRIVPTQEILCVWSLAVCQGDCVRRVSVLTGKTVFFSVHSSAVVPRGRRKVRSWTASQGDGENVWSGGLFGNTWEHWRHLSVSSVRAPETRPLRSVFLVVFQEWCFCPEERRGEQTSRLNYSLTPPSSWLMWV